MPRLSSRTVSQCVCFKAMSDIVRRFTELESDLSATDELDPYKVLEDDDIDDF